MAENRAGHWNGQQLGGGVSTEGVIEEAVLWRFLRALRVSRLLPDEDVDALGNGVSPAQIQALCEMLVREELLTPYQLKRIKDFKPEGLVLGRYRILDELGQGGFGQVFQARHSMMNRIVALKVISPRWAADEAVRDLFLREVALTTRLIHPNIVTAYDADEVDGVLFLAMEYVGGPSLERHVAERGPLSVELARTLLKEAAEAISYASVRGVVHRDIKPANILLPGLADPTAGVDARPVFAKLVDFGLARAFSRGSDPNSTIMCQEGAVIGTPAYMAPEQARNVHDADVRSDLYSLGCTIYFALTGRPPFLGTTTQEVLALSRDTEPIPVQTLNPDVPWLMAEYVRRLMAKDPLQRFQSPNDLIDALNLPILEYSFRASDSEFVFSRPQAHTRNVFPEADSRPPPAEEPVPLASEEPRPEAGEPATLEPPPPTPLLGELWQEWCEVVGRTGRGHPADIDDAEYKRLRQAVLAEARTGATTLPSGSGQLIAGLVEPWVTLRSLTDCDPRTKCELVDAVRRANAVLYPPRKSSGVFGRAAGVVLALLPGVAVGGLMVFPDRSPPSVRPLASAVRSHPALAVAAVVSSAVTGVVAARRGSRAG
jgi:eukaryotic-like serine/threonine-protein kinase